MQWRYTDVSGDPEAAARSGVADSTRDAFRSLGFSVLGHAAAHLDASLVYVAELWRSQDGQMLAYALRIRDREELGMYSMLADGTFLGTEQAQPAPSRIWIAHAVRPARSTGFVWNESRARTVSALREEHLRHVGVAMDERRARPVDHDMTTYFAMRVRSREIGEIRDATRKWVEEKATTVLSTTTWATAIAVGLARGLLAGIATGIAMFLVLPFVIQAAGAWIGPIVTRRRRWGRPSLETLLERGASVPFGNCGP